MPNEQKDWSTLMIVVQTIVLIAALGSFFYGIPFSFGVGIWLLVAVGLYYGILRALLQREHDKRR